MAVAMIPIVRMKPLIPTGISYVLQSMTLNAMSAENVRQ